MAEKQANKGFLAVVQSAQFRDVMFGVVLFLVEGVLALRYGADTYRMALTEHVAEWGATSAIPIILASLDVALIDGVFIMMLILAKYSGQSAKASKIRPFTAIGAVIMFLVMLSAAVHAMPVIAAARWAGGLLLAYIAGDILIDLFHKFQAWNRSRTKDSDRGFHDQLFSINRAVGDVLMALLTAPLVWIIVGLIDTGRAAANHFDNKALNKAPVLTTALSTANRETSRKENIVLLNQKKSMEKQERQAKTLAHIQENPTHSDTVLCEWSKSTYLISESTARADLRTIRRSERK